MRRLRSSGDRRRGGSAGDRPARGRSSARRHDHLQARPTRRPPRQRASVCASPDQPHTLPTARSTAPRCQPRASGTTYTASATGTHTFSRSRRRTRQQRRTRREASYTWTVDTTPPVLTLPPDGRHPRYTGPGPRHLHRDGHRRHGIESCLRCLPPALPRLRRHLRRSARHQSPVPPPTRRQHRPHPVHRHLVTDTTPPAHRYHGRADRSTNNATRPFTIASSPARRPPYTIDEPHAGDITATSPPRPPPASATEPHTFYVHRQRRANNPPPPHSRHLQRRHDEAGRPCTNETCDRAHRHSALSLVTYTADGPATGTEPRLRIRHLHHRASGSTFPLGARTVSCTATDNASNTDHRHAHRHRHRHDATGHRASAAGRPRLTNDTTPTFTFGPTGSEQLPVLASTPHAGDTCTSPSHPLGARRRPTHLLRHRQRRAGNTSAASTPPSPSTASPPVLTGPGNLTVEADGPGGTRVTFTVSASDGTPPVALLPARSPATPTLRPSSPSGSRR